MSYIDPDPVCLIHGKKMKEHSCLYCCLCFYNLTVETCHVRPDGSKEDVCNKCAVHEAIEMARRH